jgi:hypothetical protein
VIVDTEFIVLGSGHCVGHQTEHGNGHKHEHRWEHHWGKEHCYNGWSIFEVAVFRICRVICRDRNNISIKFVLFSESLRVKSG